MTTAQRCKYFKHLWPAACASKGWNVRDEGRRKLVTMECMTFVRGPLTDSSSGLGDDEVTALFCYLEFLAHQDDLDRSARWVDCQKDYHAFNRARQSDHVEAKLYGRGKTTKLQRERFQGEKSAVGGPLEEFDPKKIYDRHLTVASRARARAKKAAPAESGVVIPDRAQQPLEVGPNPF